MTGLTVFKRSAVLLAFSAFVLLATMNTTVECGSDTMSAEYSDECGCSSGSEVDLCRHDCDILYECGFAVPDGETGVPISVVECRGGCEKDPGNVDCVDKCVEDYENEGTCEELGSCVSNGCGIPLR